MKTIKSLLYALFAFAVLAFVGCVKDETYSAGGDLSGDKVYISNAKSTFYVKTAEEKKEAAEENKKLSHGVTRADLVSFEDDKQIDLIIARTGKKLGALDVDVEITMANEESALFILPAGSVKKGTASQTVTYTVPVKFEEGAEESALVIGFDISKLAENYEYKFNAALADAADGTQYGASSFDFVINHMVPVELPFTDIGEVTLTQSVYGDLFTFSIPSYAGIKIQIHNDDLKVIETAKAAGKEPELDFVRFFIPKFMYQMATASLALGDGALDEEDAEYFSDSDGLLLTMTTKYEPVYDYDHNTYGHPVFPDLYRTVFPLFGIAGITATGELTVWQFGSNLMVSRIHIPAFDGSTELYYSFVVGLFNGYDSSVTRVNNTYTYDMAVLYDQGGGQIGGYIGLPISFVWDTNKLEEDWANYFKVDYNNDIKYTQVGEGTFKSEYKSTEEAKTLYKGYEAIDGNTVYYVDNVYGHSTEDASLGLALLWNGTTATLAAEQPTGETAFGKELYISQSDDVKSAIEFAENGSIAKITFGVKLHFADGNVVGNYAETIEFAASDASVAKFLGSFTQTAYEIYSPYYDENGTTVLDPKLSRYSSVVTIAQATDGDGKAIEGKVLISGIISEDYLYGEDGTLEGTFDATTNSIIIPAQFFNKPVWNLGLGYKLFPYFQPGETSVNAYNTQNGPMYFSIMGTPSNSIALYLKEDGSLYMGPSSTDGSGVATDGYAVVMYSYDAVNNEFVEDAQVGELFSTFGVYGNAAPVFTPVAAEGASLAAKRVSVPKMISGGVDKAIKGNRNRIAVKNR